MVVSPYMRLRRCRECDDDDGGEFGGVCSGFGRDEASGLGFGIDLVR